MARRDYSRGRPLAEDVLLVVEVADSSLAFDAGEKADLYAAAGIADYWVVNVAAAADRSPSPAGAPAATNPSIAFSGQDELRPLLMPQVSLRPASLWPRCDRFRQGPSSVSTDELQPKPEVFLDLIRRQQRGRLKIYLGFAAGVGKTFDMLQEGNRLRRQGVDVVIGFVEAHGRAETIAQIGELEQVPRRRIEYRGIVLEEMDIDAVLARRPTIALVDELAHTNAPGSRNPKRYQDVEELLRAGISVITTLNIQHLESLHDIVERATGVRVKERIPDYVVAMADQIVNVDLSAEDLRERLQTGKIYPAERIADGHGELLRPGEADATAGAGHGGDRLPPGSASPRREPAERRAGLGLGAGHGLPQFPEPSRRRPAAQGRPHRRPHGRPWYAVYVQTPRESPEHIDAATQRRDRQQPGTRPAVGRHHRCQFKGADLVSTIAAFVKEYGITHLVSGAAAGPGIAAGSGRRSWTASCKRFPAWTWWWSTTARPEADGWLSRLDRRGQNGVGAAAQVEIERRQSAHWPQRQPMQPHPALVATSRQPGRSAEPRRPADLPQVFHREAGPLEHRPQRGRRKVDQVPRQVQAEPTRSERAKRSAFQIRHGSHQLSARGQQLVRVSPTSPAADESVPAIATL